MRELIGYIESLKDRKEFETGCPLAEFAKQHPHLFRKREIHICDFPGCNEEVIPGEPSGCEGQYYSRCHKHYGEDDGAHGAY